MDKSALFGVYNRERADARRRGTSVPRVNRGLGLAQRTAERPYLTSTTSCTCKDFQYRGSKTGQACKHMLALRMKSAASDRTSEAEILAALGF